MSLYVRYQPISLGGGGGPSTLTIGTFDGQAASADGLTITGNQLFAQSADATHPGMVNTTTQSFSGSKTVLGSSLTVSRAGGSMLAVYDTTVNANARNWGIVSEELVYGDLAIKQSNAANGNPLSAGTSALYFDFNRQATFSARVNATKAGGTGFLINDTSADAHARNWGLVSEQSVYGDLSLNQSNAAGGDPQSAGTSALYFDFNRNATIGANLTVTGTITGTGGITGNVAYTAPGTGAVARTVQGKLNDFTVDVKDFGAVGDGVTDDTAAIQAAVTYALTLSPPASVFLPGKHLVTSSILIDRPTDTTTSEFMIYGTGSGSGFYVTNTGAAFNIIDTTLFSTTHPTSEKVTFKDIKFSASNPATVNAYVISKLFLRIKFLNTYFDSIKCVYSDIFVQTWFFDDCQMRNCPGDGTTVGKRAFFDVFGLYDVLFTNCIIEQNNYFIMCLGTGVNPLQRCHSLRFVDNLCEGNVGASLTLTGCFAVIISGNYLEANPTNDLDIQGGITNDTVTIVSNFFGPADGSVCVKWGTTVSATSIGNECTAAGGAIMHSGVGNVTNFVTIGDVSAGSVTNTTMSTVMGSVKTNGAISVTGQITSTLATGTAPFVVASTTQVANLNAATAGTVTTNANLTGPITSVGNATSVASQTGTGSTFVMNTSPTLVTPNLGTPSTLVGTNITGTAASLTAGHVTTNANLTGPITSVGNATSVASQTGTGSTFVMDTSPTLVTPALGTPSALVGTNITGTASGLTAGHVTTNANLTGDVTSVGNAATLAATTNATLTTISSLVSVGTITTGVWNAGALTTSGVLTVNGTSASSFAGNVTIASGHTITAPEFVSSSANPAAAGALSLANGDTINWRNNANSADKAFGKNTSDQLTYAGTAFLSSAGVLLAAGFPALAGDVTTSAGSLTTTLAATTNSTLTTISSLVSVGTITTGVWNAGAVTSTGVIKSTSNTNGQVLIQPATTSGRATVKFVTAGESEGIVGVEANPAAEFTGSAASAFILGSNSSNPVQVATAGTVRLTADASGNIVPGYGSSGALATNATNGWLYIQTCAGTPTGVPAGSYTGRVAMVYDTTNNKFYVYNGAWKGVTLA